MSPQLDVAIIDYQMSNMFSVASACKLMGLKARITSDRDDILNARGAILPGVGSFKEAMLQLEKLDLASLIKEFISTGKPFMGICLGMQLLFTESEEFGTTRGLGIIPGAVRKFNFTSNTHGRYPVPQIGWNRISIKPKNINNWERQPLTGISDDSFMYFVHSFYVIAEREENSLSKTTYGDMEYSSSVVAGNVFASQFHPEKSADDGIRIYENFACSIKKEQNIGDGS